MRQPDFFVVGAAKSGTTALWKYFQKHPEIFVTDSISNKELGYYSNQYGVHEKIKYLNFFKEATPNQLIGEVCHVYLTSEESAQWIKKDIPNAKIIIILRNPIQRAYSLYNWMVMHGYENSSSFEKALKKEEKLIKGLTTKFKLLHKFKQNYYYYNSGLYYKQVERYYNKFGKENVLIIEYNDFKNDTEKILLNIFKFLNIRSYTIQENQYINKSKKVLSIQLQYLSRRILLSNKKYRRLFEYIMKKNILNGKPKGIKGKTLRLLKQKYIKDIEKLSNLTLIDFVQKWNSF